MAAAMPFFSAALSAGPPADPRLRLVSLALVAIGALGVAGGFAAGLDPLAAVSGATYVVGLVALLAAMLQPLRAGLGPRGGLIVVAYAVAVVDVVAGAALATSFVGGWGPVVGAWATLKPAHAWLNLLGFLSLVIAGSLIHLLPTVLGTRIRSGWPLRFTVGGTVIGAPAVALGFALGSDLLVRLGGLAAMAGAVGLLGYGFDTWRARGHWTTDPGWHRFVSGQLLGAIGWYAAAQALAGGRALVIGARPDAWRLEDVAGPLVLGWVVGAILGAWTHLLPAVGPGDGPAHAAQRRRLATGATIRLAGFQLGVAVLTVASVTGAGGALASLLGLSVADASTAAGFGLALAGAAALADVALLLGAMLQVRGRPPSQREGARPDAT
ncbi:MAG TPA: hypothetical protein VFW92_06470 [Candidatus Limnocylindrales bacterium]|nr:hypothetical protein [Candidatus Limnocylindrales bacterium]